MQNHDLCLFGKREILDRLAALRAAGRPVRADFNLASLIADNALVRQIDRGGRDYGHHTTRVALHNAHDATLMIIGKLHDVVEDSDWTLADLRAAGFDTRIVAAIDALTHRDGEKYLDSIARLAHNPDAVAVKLGDLRDNMTVSRLITLPDADDLRRLQKYTIAFNYLSAIRDGAWPTAQPLAAFLRTRPALDPGPAFWQRYSDTPYPSGPAIIRHPAAPSR